MAAPVETPAAVLWDMDGTLVDTEPYWMASEYEVVEKYGGSWSREHAMNLVGFDLLDSGRYIREHAGIQVESTGDVLAWRPASGEGIRIDAGIREGQAITADYDPMIAKVIAHGRDRAEALERLDAALADTVVLGVKNRAELAQCLDAEAAGPLPDDLRARIDGLDLRP